jgi:hypothetical protein
VSASAVEARHWIANLLHTYVAIADRKDVDAVVELLGTAQVQFPAGGSGNPDEARQFFDRLWQAPERHRHDVSNLIVSPAETEGMWLATAHYTRWILAEGAPVLHTLGQYELLVDGADWSVQQLKVSRAWMAEA